MDLLDEPLDLKGQRPKLSSIFPVWILGMIEIVAV